MSGKRKARGGSESYLGVGTDIGGEGNSREIYHGEMGWYGQCRRNDGGIKGCIWQNKNASAVQIVELVKVFEGQHAKPMETRSHSLVPWTFTVMWRCSLRG
jgi:hypothetical protein